MMRHLLAVVGVFALAYSGAAQEPKPVPPTRARTGARIRTPCPKRAAPTQAPAVRGLDKRR